MRRYLIILLAMSVIMTGAVAAFTRVMDPFGAYGRPVTDRPAKVEAITRQECRVVALGSSRTELAVDTRWDIWEGIGPACNTGLGAMEATELVAGIDYIVEETEVETLVVMLDFFMFDDNRQPPPIAYDTRFLERSPILYHLKHTLGRRDVEFAWDQWQLDREGRQRVVSVNGFPVGFIIGRGLTAEERFRRSLSTGYAEYVELEPSVSKLELLETGLTQAVDAGLDVTVIIHPIHALHLELIDAVDLWDDFEVWKESLTDVVLDVNDHTGSSIPLWDYALYDDVTIERVVAGGAGIRSWQDSSHYTSKVGRIIISDSLGLGATDDSVEIRGIDLTTVPVEGHLEEQRNARAAYRLENPDQIEFVSSIVSEAATAG